MTPRPRYGAKPKKKKTENNGQRSRPLGPTLPNTNGTPSSFSPTDRAMMRMLTSALRENTKINESRLTQLISLLQSMGFEVEWIEEAGKPPQWAVKPPDDPVVREESSQADESEEVPVESTT